MGETKRAEPKQLRGQTLNSHPVNKYLMGVCYTAGAVPGGPGRTEPGETLVSVELNILPRAVRSQQTDVSYQKHGKEHQEIVVEKAELGHGASLKLHGRRLG